MNLDVDKNHVFEEAKVVEQVEVDSSKKEESTPLVTKQAISALNSGQIIGKTFEDQYRLAKAYCASGLVPKAFDTPEKVLLGMQLAYELNLKPISALRQIMVVNGVPSIWGDLPLGIVRSSGLLKTISEKLFDKEGLEICEANKNLKAEPDYATCRTERTNGDVRDTSFSMEEAKQAGLLAKDIWKGYPKRMLKSRARSENLKDNFGDVLSGVMIAEYEYGIEGGENLPPINASYAKPIGKAADLNTKFGV